jgi:hypothetical protein
MSGSSIGFGAGTFITSLPSPPSSGVKLPDRGPVQKLVFGVQDLSSVIRLSPPSDTRLVATPANYPSINSRKKEGSFSNSAVNEPLPASSLTAPSYASDTPVSAGSLTAAANPAVTIPLITTPAAPTAPSSSSLTAPTLNIIERARLTPIELLEYTAIEIEQFEPDVPEYESYSPALLDAPEELEYAGDVYFISDTKRDMYVSVSQDALAAAETRYFAIDETFERQKVFAQAAARGFSAPTGLITAGLLDTSEKYARRRREVREKSLLEVEERVRKRVTAAVNTLLTLEGKHAGLMYAHAAKSLEVSRLNLQLLSAAINNDIESFNTAARTVNALVAAYRAYTRAVAEQDEAVISQLTARRAAVRTHKADLEMYGAQIDMYRASIDISKLSVDQQALGFEVYESLVQAYQQDLQIARAQISAAEEAVRAMSQKTEADIALVSTYVKQAESEASRVAVYNANVDTYSAMLRGNSAQQQAYGRYVNESISTFSAKLDEYREYINAQRTYVQNYVAESQALLDVTKAWARATTAETQFQSTDYSAKLEYAVATVNKDLLSKEYSARKDLIEAQIFAEDARIKAGLEAAKASAAAGLAQAAYSTLSVSARITDEGGFNDDVAGSDRMSASISGRRAWTSTTKHEDTV